MLQVLKICQVDSLTQYIARTENLRIFSQQSKPFWKPFICTHDLHTNIYNCSYQYHGQAFRSTNFVEPGHCDITHTIHVWYIYLHVVLWLIFMVHVGKYTMTMDAMGNSPSPCREHDHPVIIFLITIGTAYLQ